MRAEARGGKHHSSPRRGCHPTLSKNTPGATVVTFERDTSTRSPPATAATRPLSMAATAEGSVTARVSRQLRTSAVRAADAVTVKMPREEKA